MLNTHILLLMNVLWQKLASHIKVQIDLDQFTELFRKELELIAITVMSHDALSSLPTLCKCAPCWPRGEMLSESLSCSVRSLALWVRLVEKIVFHISGEVKAVNPTQPLLAHSFPDVQPAQLHERGHSWTGIRGEGRSRDREMLWLMSWESPQWGYLDGLSWIPPACLSSLSTGLSGGARSSGRWPSEFLRDRSAPWSSRRDTSSGLRRRAAMCSGESPHTLSLDTLLFTPAPKGEQRLMRYEPQITEPNWCRRRISDSSVKAEHHLSSLLLT